MDLAPNPRTVELRERLLAFMEECVYPAERESGPTFELIEELKAEARSRGLWNLFYPEREDGPGLTQLEYAPLAEVMGRSFQIAPEATNCAAPDTGNMELLHEFGDERQRARWLAPLLAGTTRSGFAMTEPEVASSDATNVRTSIRREGDELVVNGRKWWTTNGLHPKCDFLIVMGKSAPQAPTHRQQSMVIVPIGTPGLTLVRDLSVFGYHDLGGHAEVTFDDVRVPADHLIANEGDGFAIAQARLGPGRVHHCMRLIGMAERALELLCQRALSRTTFGQPVAANANVQDWIAESRVELEMVRLLTLKTAWMMDNAGSREARLEIAAIKLAAPRTALRITDRAIQIHGGGGVSGDFPLAEMWAHQRTLRIADGPDEVHKRTIARLELRRHRDAGSAGSTHGAD